MKGYRADIDGLRAIAVLAVVLFHAGVPGFTGGYAGVDVFFVISGFLISGVIRSAVERGGFSIVEFYERRVRRILPALLAVLVVTAAMVLIVFLPRDVDRVGQSLVATSLFASNVLFWRRAGYFEATAHTKPLLHTWSLSVEEQYYVFFPLLLAFLLRKGRHATILTLLAACAVSFVASALLVESAPSAAFYLPHSRVWELMCGALLALGALPRLESKAVGELVAAAGLVMVVVSILTLDEYSSFPGVGALMPVIGSALVIYGGALPGVWVSRALSVRPLVFIGLVSYSWYLWHWPLLSIMGYARFGALSLVESVGLVVLAFGIAVASWRWIETPFRGNNGVVGRRALFVLSAVSFTGVIAFGLVAVATDGWSSRAKASVQRLEAAGDDSSPYRSRCHASDRLPIPYDLTCVFGDSSRAPAVVVWGDSYGAELAPALGESVGTEQGAVRQITYSACSAGSSFVGSPKVGCVAHNRLILQKLIADRSAEVVLLAANYPSERERHFADYFDELERNASALASAGKSVVLIYPHPKYAFAVPSQLAMTERSGGVLAAVGMPTTTFDSTFRARTLALERVRTSGDFYAFLPKEVLCPGARCLTMDRGNVLYFDELHLSMSGARTLLPAIRALLARIATEQRVRDAI